MSSGLSSEHSAESTQEEPTLVSPVDPVEAPHSDEEVTFMVTLERPPANELVDYNVAEKYQLLKDLSEDALRSLRAWIEKQGLADQVVRIGPPTTFSVLFITGSPKLGKELTKAPRVIDVVPTEDFRVDLPTPAEGAPYDVEELESSSSTSGD